MISAASIGSSKSTVRWLAGFLYAPMAPHEQRGGGFLLTAFSSGVGKRAAGLAVLVRLERCAHQLHADQRVVEPGGVPDGDFDRLHRGEARGLVVAQVEVGAHGVFEGRVERAGQALVGFESRDALGILRQVSAVAGELAEGFRLAGHLGQQRVCLQPGPGIGESVEEHLGVRLVLERLAGRAHRSSVLEEAGAGGEVRQKEERNVPGG